MKKLITGLIIGGLMAIPFAQAATTSSERVKNKMSEDQIISSDKAIKSLEKMQNSLLKTVHKSVLDAYNDVLKATQILSTDGKNKKVISLLQAATGKFDVALAADPALNLVPINADVAIDALITTPELINTEIELATDFLEEHKLQKARALLEPLKDEMVVTHTYLPMGTYPDAIKLATKHLVAGKKDEALATLATAFSTIVVEKNIIPLAFIRSENLLNMASELDKKKDKDKARDLLSAAEEQLDIATLLGYLDKDSKAYESIKAQIKLLRKEIDGKNAVEKMYEKVKSSIKNLIGSKQANKTQ